MSDSENLQEKIKRQSWISQLILRCPDTGDCAFSKDENLHQHAFTARIVPPNDDSRSLLLIQKGVFFSNLEPVPFDPSIDSPRNCCFNCQKEGYHKYKNCTKEKKLFCSNCGRRNVQVADCPRCAKGYEEWEKNNSSRPVRSMPPRSTDMSSRDKSRARSRGRTPVETSVKFTDISARDRSRGRSRNRVPEESRDFRDKTRGRARNVETFEEKKSRDKSRGQSRVRWIDLQDRNEEKDSDDKRVNVEKDVSQSVDNSIRKLIEVMAAIKHLPPNTQNAVVLHFLEEQRAAMK